jgi:polysaccharide biosynthesis transport protein
VNDAGLELPTANSLVNPFRDPIGIVERHGRWMLAALSFGVLASLLIWSRSAPRYFAEATVVVARPPLSDRIVEPSATDNGLAITEALAAQVLSGRNLAAIVTEFKLYPGLVGVETTAEIVERVRSQVTIQAAQRLDAAASAGERAYSIGFDAATPEAAAGVANRLAALFADTSSAGRAEEQQVTLDLLHRELAKTQRELQEQTDAIAEFRTTNRNLLPDELMANLARLQSLDQRRSSLAFEIAQAGAQVASFASADGSSPELRLARLREELNRARVHKTERHPDVLNLERQIADLEQRLAHKPRTSAPRAQTSLQLSEQTLGVLRQQLDATETEITELDAQIHQMSTVEEQLKALEGRASILRENYLDVLRKVQNAELGGKLLDTQQNRRVSVLNLAEPPSRPYRTPIRNLVLGLLASIGCALAVGLVLELLNPVVVAAEEITAISGQPVLGWVTRIR